jgi:hypothetical protein
VPFIPDNERGEDLSKAWPAFRLCKLNKLGGICLVGVLDPWGHIVDRLDEVVETLVRGGSIAPEGHEQSPERIGAPKSVTFDRRKCLEDDVHEARLSSVVETRGRHPGGLPV